MSHFLSIHQPYSSVSVRLSAFCCFFHKVFHEPQNYVFYCHSKFHCIDLFSLPLWHGEYLHASRVTLLSYCSVLLLNIKNFSPKVSITDLLEAKKESDCHNCRNSQILYFDHS